MPAKILIVEDEMLIAMEIESVVEDQGHISVGIATTAREAIKIAETEKPDLALVDLHLADGVTGHEVGRQLAEAGVAVIFATANSRLLGTGVPGALGVLDKPIGDREIVGVLDFALAYRGGAPVAPPPALRLFES